MVEKCHMMPLVDETESGVEVKRWVGIFLEVVMEEDKRLEGWVCHGNEGYRMGIQDLDE